MIQLGQYMQTFVNSCQGDELNWLSGLFEDVL